MKENQAKQATNLQRFAFEAESEIRVIPNDGNPLFCLSDVLHVLGVSNPSYVKERLNPKGVVLNYTLTKGGKQHLLFISEGNLYKVIFRSDKPNARKFEDWVTDEVLPAIRKTGSYTTPRPQLKQLDLQDSKERLLAMPNLLTSKPTHCLVLSCHRANGTVKRLFIHYNQNDGWFGETPVDMANVMSGASSGIACFDKDTVEYAYKWYKIADEKYTDTPFVFCRNKK